MPIHLLPESLQNQIAAGEVVERPASIVKELVENSVDAHAQNIQIEIENGGITKIRVIDDGKGMNTSDAQKCFTRYATSKISKIDDLFSLSSFGFRGEALASIASVALVTLRTKPPTEPIGTEIIYKQTTHTPPKHLESRPCSMPHGTEIIVENIFWNVPARRKFLKPETTETREIVKIIENFAISLPHISFSLTVNGTEKISVLKEGLKNRAKNILGHDITQHFLPLFYKSENIQISGFTTHYNYHRSNKTRQYIFVNTRMVTADSLVSSAVAQAYETLLPRGKFPSFILHITLRPDEVDVNVHPRKTQVKFLNASTVFTAIKQAFSSALESTQAKTHNTHSPQPHNPSFIPSLSTQNKHSSVHSSAHTPPTIPKPSSPSLSPPVHTPSFPNPISTQQNFLEHHHCETTDTPYETKQPLENWKIIGQIRNSFIVVEEPTGIRIVDQHAAHERVRLESLTEKLQTKKIVSQPLLTPCVFSLSISDKERLLEQTPYLQSLGFEIEDFGKNEIAIHAVPSGNNHIDIAKLFREVLDNCDFFEPEFSDITHSFTKKLLSYTACRGAKMFGDPLSMSEMEALIRDWKQCKTQHSCAHGRPVSVLYPFDEIEKKCGRC